MIRIYENARQEKLIELGFVCYNGYSDGTLRTVYFSKSFYEIKNIMDKLLVSRYQMDSALLAQRYEYLMKEKILELGCTCYSLYVDDIIYDSAINGLCEYIRQINTNIMRMTSQRSYYTPVNTASQKSRLIDATDESINISDNSIIHSSPNSSESEFRYIPYSGEYATYPSAKLIPINANSSSGGLPHGMELIPADYIRCRCGYRNRSYAVFCARCGRQL